MAVGGGAAVAGGANARQAEEALSALCVAGAGEAFFVQADLTAGAVGVLQAVFALVGSEVALLACGTLGVIAATGGAGTALADLTCAALYVLGARLAGTLEADPTALAVATDQTVFAGQRRGIAETGATVGVIAATRAAGEGDIADLALAALGIGTASWDAATAGIADQLGVAAVDIVVAGGTGKEQANQAIGAVFVFEAVAASEAREITLLSIGAVGVFAATWAAALALCVADQGGRCAL